MKSVLCVLLLLGAAPFASTQQCKLCADTVFFNGHILTGVHLRADDSSAIPAVVSAVAIRHGLIVGVGTDQAMLAEATATTKVDLHGAFTMPGFNDAHTHMAFAGQQKLTVDLDNVASLAVMQDRMKTYAASLSDSTAWITGGGWDQTKWASQKLPTRQDLDAVTGAHPAYLERTDGHIAVLNTAALAAAGITPATPSPKGGQIDLDPTSHQLTGIVRDAALTLIRPRIPPPDAAAHRRALHVALADAGAHGVTSVQDFSNWADFLVLEDMETAGELTVRVSEWLTFGDPVDTLKAHRDHHPATDPMLHTGMLKGFMDGSLGSRTAALLAPYSDDPTNSGLPRYDQSTLNTMAAERAEAGFQLGFHAIGDRANAMALIAFSFAQRERMQQMRKLLPQLEAATHASISVTDTSRFRIEHAQVLAPADFDRFARLHIVASMQPSHLLTDMAWAGARLGPQRSRYAYAWRAFLNHKVPLAFGTDYPVESVNPFRGLYSAVTRMNEAGTQTFQPQEKLTIQEAIYAYTQGSAFAENMEKQKGRLEPGFFADLVVLDRDPTLAAPQDLLHTRVLRTVVAGKSVYTAPTASASATAPPHRNARDDE